jgi:hypothetical protein
MALKGDRYEVVQDISFWMNEAADRGGIVSVSTAGSGAALDQAAALVTYSATVPSGNLLPGLLLGDMVDNDQTRLHDNWHQNQEPKGGKVVLLVEGWVVTNMIDPGITVATNDVAYVGPSGLISNVDSGDPNGKVGRFLSLKDEDGYAKVYVKLPN